MNYQIKYKYRTGNSLGSHPETDILELEFKNYDVAKANLIRIKEHYDFVTSFAAYHSYYKAKEINPIDNNKDKDWLVKTNKYFAVLPDKDVNRHGHCIDKEEFDKWINKGYDIVTVIDEEIAKDSIILYTDDGKPWQFSCPWVGYFESLSSIEIIIPENKFEF